MTNKLVKAIAVKLNQLWPERQIFVKEVPQGIDGNFFIKVIETSHEKKLDTRRAKGFSFDVAFFLKNNDTLEYFAWADAMAANFELLQVDNQQYHVTGMRSRVVDRVGHVTFNIDFTACLREESNPDELMQKLYCTQEVSDG